VGGRVWCELDVVLPNNVQIGSALFPRAVSLMQAVSEPPPLRVYEAVNGSPGNLAYGKAVCAVDLRRYRTVEINADGIGACCSYCLSTLRNA
jgi:hypothetical protein